MAVKTPLTRDFKRYYKVFRSAWFECGQFIVI